MNDAAVRAPRSGPPLPLLFEALLTRLKRAAHFVTVAGVTWPSVIYAMAAAADATGFADAAARLYERAIRRADRSSDRRVFLVRQGWEFAAERQRFRCGKARVVDPLFAVSAEADTASRDMARRSAAGYYEVHVTHRGLRIDGYLRPGVSERRIDVLVDDRPLRSTEASRVGPGLWLVVVHVQRDALAALPPSLRLSVRLVGAGPLLFRGCRDTVLQVPHGIGAAGCDVRIDKKGFLARDTTGVDALQRGFLRIYANAVRFFADELRTPLFVLYGTLLGQHRSGDFIAGDDDFDVGYWSDATSSDAVRAEGMDFVVRLVRAGFIVTINRVGRLFRLRLPDLPPACHLDVHAVWHERGSAWIHPCANLNCRREDFLPARQARLGDADVITPARPEAFLEAYYGPDWRIPNPAYSTAARPFAHWKSRWLRRSCVTPALVQDLQRRIGAAATGGGQLFAIGSQSIYPLERYEALCDW